MRFSTYAAQTTAIAGDCPAIELRPDVASLEDEIRRRTGYTLQS